jgi:hypothetical protein
MTAQDIERARKVFSEKLHASDGLRHYLEVVVPSHAPGEARGQRAMVGFSASRAALG